VLKRRDTHPGVYGALVPDQTINVVRNGYHVIHFMLLHFLLKLLLCENTQSDYSKAYLIVSIRNKPSLELIRDPPQQYLRSIA
jgi:hypothetical protein